MAQPGLNRCILKKSLLRACTNSQKINKPKRFSTLHYQCVLKNDSNQHFTKKGINSIGSGGVNLNYCTAVKNDGSIFSTENGETIIRSPYPDISDDNRPLGEFILSRLKKYKDLTLLVDNPTGRTYTGAQFKDHVIRVTSALYKQGFRKGDVVVLTGTNSVEYGIVCIALCLIGAVTSTANPAFTPGELARQLTQSRACAVFSSQSNVAILREALATDKELQDRVKVKDPMTGKLLSVGETGELLFKGPQIMKGYFNNPEATAHTVKDGWLHSGDIGMVDADGYFVISDRLKELIKYKGFQIAPAELEALLCSHPGIQDAAVVGLKAGEDVGEVPRAFVVTKPDAKLSDTDITEFVKQNVAPYKQLRGGVEFITEIPKTASGKILRRNLKS